MENTGRFDKNTIIGLVLILGLLLAWQWMMQPSAEQIQRQKVIMDSLAMVEHQKIDSLHTQEANVNSIDTIQEELPDSLKIMALQSRFGPFAAAANGEKKEYTLENDLIEVTFTNKGGRIQSVWLKEYKKVVENEKKKEEKFPLFLLEDAKNRFEYTIPVNNGALNVKTSDLYFSAETSGNTITFRADAGNGRYLEQKYTITPDHYKLDYDLTFNGLDQVIPANTPGINLFWLNYLDKLEKNHNYERNYSTAYYRSAEGSTSYCKCTGNDTEDLSGKPVKWISHANQFFNTSLIAKVPFSQAVLQTEMLDPKNEDLKILTSNITIPYKGEAEETYSMQLYLGPNKFELLREMGDGLEEVVPFGSSILGTINRWVIRPVFNILLSFISSEGIVILLLTLVVKLVLYPLTYRMLYSQSKMGALKPQLEVLKEKHKDDPQAQQVETMKIYREFGVNPLGGCLPMLLQMPIWIALYRFFPASIEFRQAGFLWATDLSSYDVFLRLPFEIPFGFGSHISLFTVLWAITTLIYTYYSSRHMDFSTNPAMKWMQYIMPIMFLGFFNSFASGLTCYMLFSNVLNIGQTLVTKNYIINQDKIKAELEANRNKPKKKGGFQERLELALKEQQRVQAQKKTDTSDKNKGKK